MRYYTEQVETVLRQFGSRPTGLSSDEVAKAAQQFGKNTIKVTGEPLWRKLLEPFMNVFVAVLLAAIVLSLVTGHTLDAAIIGFIIFISATIYYVQRISTERVLRALKQHDAQTVHVLRDEKVIEIPTEQLVPGDIVNLSEGEKVPADGRLLKAESVRTDESMLTGESLPMSKSTEPLPDERPIYERSNMLFQGSYVVSGQATLIVTETGMNTEFGHLAQLATPTAEQSPAQAKINRLISKIIVGIGIVSVVVFVLASLRGMEFIETVRFVLSLAVSAVPEDIPIAITVILVLGMRRLAKYKALARSMKAVENIGIVTTIASDKTGTLTQNKLSVQKTWQPARTKDFSAWILLAANNTKGVSGDPLDTAMAEFAAIENATIPSGSTLVTGLSFDQTLAMSGNVWKTKASSELVIKGAPEKIIDRALSNKTLRQEAESALHDMTSQGYRVIALARTDITKTPASIADASLDKIEFLGLIGVADQLRPDAKQAIKEAQSAGITVRMITGDHAETAYAIGKQLDLVERRDQVLDCRTLDKMSDTELSARISDTRVFARVLPDAKYRILELLEKHDITAMTGDGVNDVPALTRAHVGLAMGSGSQIAKEAGDIVLLDNNFATIIHAVREGRVIYDNIRRMLFYLLATSIGEVIVMIGALIIGLPLPVLAVQILWINLVTDTAMVIPLGLESAEEDVMKRPPRRAKQPVLDRHLIERLLIVAAAMAITTLAVFAYYIESHGIDYARTIAFSALVVAQWANALNARSEWSSILVRMRTVNKPLIFGFLVAFVLQLLVLFGPLAEPLHVMNVAVIDLAITGTIAAIAVIIAGELHKLLRRRID